jgi:hypothetical protein
VLELALLFRLENDPVAVDGAFDRARPCLVDRDFPFEGLAVALVILSW